MKAKRDELIYVSRQVSTGILHLSRGNETIIALDEKQARRVVLGLLEFLPCEITPPTTEEGWNALPTRCVDFRVIDIGEFDRCVFIAGHSGPHSFTVQRTAPDPPKETL